MTKLNIMISCQLRKKIDWLKEHGVDPFVLIRKHLNAALNDEIAKVKALEEKDQLVEAELEDARSAN